MNRIINVELFAGPREHIGRPSIEVPMTGSEVTAQDVLNDLASRYPEQSAVILSSRLAVNDRFIRPTDVVADHATVALIPPVSGG